MTDYTYIAVSTVDGVTTVERTDLEIRVAAFSALPNGRWHVRKYYGPEEPDFTSSTWATRAEAETAAIRYADEFGRNYAHPDSDAGWEHTR
jgi:hypothetical protein